MTSSASVLPRAASSASRPGFGSKCAPVITLPGLVTRMMRRRPERAASSTPYWMIGRSTSGRSSFGNALVAGRMRVPRPAAGNTAVRSVVMRAAIVS